MVTKKQIQEILKTGFSKNILSKMSESQIKKLHEMVNAIGFMGMDKPIGRMTSVGKKTEAKEQTTPQNTTQTSKTVTTFEVKPNSKTMVNGVEVDTTGGKTRLTPVTETEMTEGKKKTKKKVEKNPWAICTSSLDLEGKKRDDYTKVEKKKFEKCVLGVK